MFIRSKVLWVIDVAEVHNMANLYTFFKIYNSGCSKVYASLPITQWYQMNKFYIEDMKCRTIRMI